MHIKERCTAVQDVSPMLFVAERQRSTAHYKGNDMYDVNLFGVEEAYADGGQVDMHLGRFFTDEESRRRAPVAVIGADIEKGLFANIDPHRQDHQRGRPSVSGDRHHAASRRIVLRRYR